MAILFRPIQSQLTDKQGRKLFYPRVVLKGNVSTNQIAQEIAEVSSLMRGDTKNTLDTLTLIMARHLQASESVTIDGLGTFMPVMHAKGKGVESADQVSASQAVMTVRFLPSVTRHLNRTIATRALVTGATCLRYDKLSAAASDGTGASGGNTGGTETGGNETGGSETGGGTGGDGALG